MDFKQLETFVTIVKLKSFSKAAQHLYLTQPTISNHVQNLENELQTILINRSNKNISLTRAGELFYKYAIDILNKRESAIFSLNKFKGKIEGILEISASTIPEQYFLPNILKKFKVKYPDVQFNLKKYDSNQVIEKILSGEIDFGIVGAKAGANQLEYIDILDDKIVLVSSTSKKLENIHDIEMNDIPYYPLIFREEGSGTRKIVEDMLLKNNIFLHDLNIIAYIENTETIKQFIKEDMGLTFISKRAVSHEINNNEIKEIQIKNFNVHRKFYFVYHRNRALSPLAETFKQFVLDHK